MRRADVRYAVNSATSLAKPVRILGGALAFFLRFRLRLVLGADKATLDPHRAVGPERHERSGKRYVALAIGLLVLGLDRCLDAFQLGGNLGRHIAIRVFVVQGLVPCFQLAQPLAFVLGQRRGLRKDAAHVRTGCAVEFGLGHDPAPALRRHLIGVALQLLTRQPVQKIGIGEVPATLTIYALNPNYRTPYTINSSIQITRQLSKNDALTVGYVNTEARELTYYLRDMNLINPTGTLAHGRPIYSSS